MQVTKRTISAPIVQKRKEKKEENLDPMLSSRVLAQPMEYALINPCGLLFIYLLLKGHYCSSCGFFRNKAEELDILLKEIELYLVRLCEWMGIL